MLSISFDSCNNSSKVNNKFSTNGKYTKTIDIDIIEKSNIGKHKCKTAIGIGIIYESISGIILKAPQEYPAYKCGIRVQDVLIKIYPNPKNLKIKDGVKVQFIRNSQIDEINCYVDEVCFNTN